MTVLNRGQTQGQLPAGVGRILADRSQPQQVTAALRGRRFDAAFDISGYNPSEIQPVIAALDGNVGSYVFCSTVGVYAPTDLAPIREEFPLIRGCDAGEYRRDGTSEAERRRLLFANKILCEDILVKMFSRSGFPATIIRPPYIYGPHEPGRRMPDGKNRLFGIFARLARGRKLIVPGDGLAMTHSVHVDDVATAFAAVPGRSEAVGKVYNASGPEAVTFNGYVNLIASIMGVDAETVHVEVRDYEAMLEDLAPLQASEIFDYPWKESPVYSNEKLCGELGWSPRYGIHDGVEMTYRWWLEQDMEQQPWDLSLDDRALVWLESHSSLGTS